MIVGIVSNTHIGNDAELELLCNELESVFSDVELIIHAGDICDARVIERLGRIAPVEAVRSAEDYGDSLEDLPVFKVIELGGLKIGISHNPISADVIRNHNLNIVINGMDHYPGISELPECILRLNPGSPTRPVLPPPKKFYTRRKSPLPTVLILEIDEGLSFAYIVPLKNLRKPPKPKINTK